MAKKIILLSRRPDETITLAGIFWLDVSAARQAAYANPSATSAYKDATGPEIAALQAGQVLEFSWYREWPPGTGVAAIRAALVNQFNAEQTRLSAQNPWQFYGTFWDGTAWTAAGTA
jgi:hypothetical protein